ncbi:hypothetical protein [Algibacillus agarilyticus]|uniref:hypothetical protein n=1 Tax=Algibacillus agarilyticus TaxID=2234133 RepID=UPI000DD0865E|nr:hypothetical protein [Algibacillus agarilyticus]
MNYLNMKCFLFNQYLKVVRLLASLILVFFSCLVQSSEVAEIQASKIALDSREHFNSRSIYVELGNKSFVFFHKIHGFHYKKMSIRVSELPISGQPPMQSKAISTIESLPNNTFTSLSGLTSVDGEQWLYFTVSAELKTGSATIMKGRLQPNAELTDITKVAINDGLRGLSWPYIYYDNGLYYLVYRKNKCCGLGLAVSDNGIDFETRDTLNKTGFMPAINQFASGSLIYTYQRSFNTGELKPNGKMRRVIKSRYKISHDKGQSWQTEQIMSSAVHSVHDAVPFLRKDGNIDLYYSHGFNREPGHWSLWRRCVSPAGKLGKEYLIADQSIGHVAKPNIFRRGDGSIAVLFIEQGENILNGPIQYFSVLQNDAACDL